MRYLFNVFLFGSAILFMIIHFSASESKRQSEACRAQGGVLVKTAGGNGTLCAKIQIIELWDVPR